MLLTFVLDNVLKLLGEYLFWPLMGLEMLTNLIFHSAFHLLDYLEANDSMLMGIMMRFRTLSATNQSLVQMLIDTSDQVHMYCQLLHLRLPLFENVWWDTVTCCL